MRPFRIIVHGTLTPKQTSEGLKARGFYTARAVMAASPEAAGLEAIGLIAADPRIDGIMAEWESGRPDIVVDQVVELGVSEMYDSATMGFIFYSDDEADTKGPSSP